MTLGLLSRGHGDEEYTGSAPGRPNPAGRMFIPEPEPLVSQPRPDDLPDRTVVVVPLRCRSCGYDLRGIAARGRCPECGEVVWETIRRIIDPEARELPTLSRPAVLGVALVAVCLMILVVIGLRLTPSVLTLLAQPAGWSDSRLELHEPPRAIVSAALLLGATTTMASICMALLITQKQAHTAGRLMALSTFCWTVAAAIHGMALAGSGVDGRTILLELTMFVMATGVYFGLGGVMAHLGEYSRHYRLADRRARQPIPEMIWALIGVWVGLMLRYGGTLLENGGVLLVFGTIVTGVASLLLLIGQVYLLMNSVWIARALLSPPLDLADLVGQRLDPPGSDGSHEDTS